MKHISQIVFFKKVQSPPLGVGRLTRLSFFSLSFQGPPKGVPRPPPFRTCKMWALKPRGETPVLRRFRKPGPPSPLLKGFLTNRIVFFYPKTEFDFFQSIPFFLGSSISSINPYASLVLLFRFPFSPNSLPFKRPLFLQSAVCVVLIRRAPLVAAAVSPAPPLSAGRGESRPLFSPRPQNPCSFGKKPPRLPS